MIFGFEGEKKGPGRAICTASRGNTTKENLALRGKGFSGKRGHFRWKKNQRRGRRKRRKIPQGNRCHLKGGGNERASRQKNLDLYVFRAQDEPPRIKKTPFATKGKPPGIRRDRERKYFQRKRSALRRQKKKPKGKTTRE